MTGIEIADGIRAVHVRGVHKALALKSRLQVPLDHVVAVGARAGGGA